MSRIQTGDTEPILFLVLQPNGQAATGLTTIRLRIQRLSDSLLFDFADSTFKAVGHTTLDATMTELDATNAPGIYILVGGFDTNAITNASTDDSYLLIPKQTIGNNVLPFPSTLDVGQWADDIGKIDDFPTTIPGAAATGSLLDRLANKDGSKTYDQSNDSLEAISDKLDTHLGAGARQITIHVQDGAALDIPDVEVSIFNDTNTVFLTRGTTDSNGDFVTGLDDASYNVRLVKAGFTFTVPEPFTVTADATFTFTGAGVVIIPPSAPNLCVIFGTLVNAAGEDLVGACVQAFAVVDPPQVVAGLQMADPIAEVLTDQDGFFQIELVRNSEVRFVIEEAGFDQIKTVPDLASQDLTTWP